MGTRNRVRVVNVRPVGARCHGVGVTQGSALLHPGLKDRIPLGFPGRCRSGSRVGTRFARDSERRFGAGHMSRPTARNTGAARSVTNANGVESHSPRVGPRNEANPGATHPPACNRNAVVARAGFRVQAVCPSIPAHDHVVDVGNGYLHAVAAFLQLGGAIQGFGGLEAVAQLDGGTEDRRVLDQAG